MNEMQASRGRTERAEEASVVAGIEAAGKVLEHRPLREALADLGRVDDLGLDVAALEADDAGENGEPDQVVPRHELGRGKRRQGVDQERRGGRKLAERQHMPGSVEREPVSTVVVAALLDQPAAGEGCQQGPAADGQPFGLDVAEQAGPDSRIGLWQVLLDKGVVGKKESNAKNGEVDVDPGAEPGRFLERERERSKRPRLKQPWRTAVGGSGFVTEPTAGGGRGR
jgi:hypothetical protein